MPAICLVDDDAFVRDALSLGLTDAGLKVLTAPGAAAGFDIITRQRVDLLVTDMNMPGTDGAEFIVQVRARWPGLPIVAISGADHVDGRPVADIARELGADAALQKPFRANELATLIAGLLAGG
jgi:DNA-binding response OmpR family regulator